MCEKMSSHQPSDSQIHLVFPGCTVKCNSFLQTAKLVAKDLPVQNEVYNSFCLSLNEFMLEK